MFIYSFKLLNAVNFIPQITMSADLQSVPVQIR